MEQLAWFVANVAQIEVPVARRFMQELITDVELTEQLRRAAAKGGQSRATDSVPRFGRRAGWYALVRALRPDHVLETGTDKGLGTMVLAAALLRNGTGRVTTMDLQPKAGSLISGRWADVVDLQVGDSLSLISKTQRPIGLFVHDSLHTVEHEHGEFEKVRPLLTEGGILMSDAAHHSSVLQDWAEEHGWRFSFFREDPVEHWYPGGGIGVAYRPK